PQSLRTTVDAETCEPQHRERGVGQPLLQTLVRYRVALDAPGRHSCEAEDVGAPHRDPGRGEVELELILAGVVLEEPVERRVAAGERAAVVLAPQEAYLQLSHASARRGD